jgi:hypothetical protein
MTDTIQRALLSVAALALVASSGLSSCSKPAEQNATEQNAAEPTSPTSNEQAGTESAAAGQDVSAQNAKALLKAMSDYLAAQKSISLGYDSIFEVVSEDKQKLQIAMSGTVDLSRPDKLRTTRKTGFSDTETIYDGKTLTFFGKGKNAYMQAEVTGTTDSVIDQLRDKFHRQLPGADLLGSNVYDALMTDVTDVKDLGSGVIDGKECDHLAFRAKDTDWQIWIAQGDQPYPCRYVITSTGVDQAPQFSMTIRDWKASAAASSSDYSFKPPAGATKMDIKDLETLKETSDLPENYRIGAEK